MSRRVSVGGDSSIDVSLDRLCNIILLARLAEQDAAVANDGGMQSADRSASAKELRDAIERLSSDDQAVLVALAWIGRGDFSPAEFDHALVQAFSRPGEPASAYLARLPGLSDLLERGAALGGAEIGAPMQDMPPPRLH